MPIRPQNLATMSATIAGAASSAANRRPGAGPVTVVFETGYRQVVEGPTGRPLAHGQGGIVALETGEDTRHTLFAGATCHPTLLLRSGRGPAAFEVPVRAGSIKIG
ncbi:hypothetical protein [Actinorugispora endophytica]|uniref:Uncharacterized protein n=1 Tax=Actinorugispora endophytica TaxID=1605990 RepID=A0A4V3D9F0_9ACTN|nr:hypothetical protein [Actinorugispora endophytica]TDQ55250.1 hypothetical protein EV190_101575 [Actinorugispora endophytica]